MTVGEAVGVLRSYNVWRRSAIGEGGIVNSYAVGEAIDTVCDYLEGAGRELTWKDMKRIVIIADSLLTRDVNGKLPDFCDSEEDYYTAILTRFQE